MTATQIVIGGTGPLTGSESAYKPVLTGAQAYFSYVNAHGGVNGRKIVYKIEDDNYDPSQTVSQTQKLVESDHVFAIFNTIGTEQSIAISSYLNQRKVPELFVGSGATAIGNNHAKTPWTIGLLPSFEGEGAVYGRLVAQSHPNAKIGVLYENDEYGKELLAGLKRGLGSHSGQIVSTASYDVTDVTVASQVQQLKAAGADTFMIFALPAQAIQAFVSASRLGWNPAEYVTSVSIDPAVMQIVQLSAGAGVGTGATSTAFLHDPTNPTQQSAAGVKLYKAIMKKYLPGEDPKAVAHLYGMMAAYAMVDALKQAGRNPTRASLLKAATHMHETNPFLLPGIPLSTSPSNYFPIGRPTSCSTGRGTGTCSGSPYRQADVHERTAADDHDPPRGARRRTRGRDDGVRGRRARSQHRHGVGCDRRHGDDASLHRPADDRRDRRRSTSSSRTATPPNLDQAANTTIGTTTATANAHDLGLTLPLLGPVTTDSPVGAHGGRLLARHAHRGLEPQPQRERARRSCCRCTSTRRAEPRPRSARTR